jgi:hypothetical protein
MNSKERKEDKYERLEESKERHGQGNYGRTKERSKGRRQSNSQLTGRGEDGRMGG